jgi:hypothetical protein
VCPHLGLLSDRATHYLVPDRKQACYASGKGSSLTLDHQQAFCYSGAHRACPRYRDREGYRSAGQRSRLRGRARRWLALVAAMAVLLAGSSVVAAGDSRHVRSEARTAPDGTAVPHAAPGDYAHDPSGWGVAAGHIVLPVTRR